MMKKNPLASLLVITCAVLAAMATTSANAQTKAPDPALLAKAKIAYADAEKSALKQVPNATVKESELEEEDGGLRWSFDLKSPGSKKITEVGVDAVTGKVIENKTESEGEEDEKSPRHVKSH